MKVSRCKGARSAKLHHVFPNCVCAVNETHFFPRYIKKIFIFFGLCVFLVQFLCVFSTVPWDA